MPCPASAAGDALVDPPGDAFGDEAGVAAPSKAFDFFVWKEHEVAQRLIHIILVHHRHELLHALPVLRASLHALHALHHCVEVIMILAGGSPVTI